MKRVQHRLWNMIVLMISCLSPNFLNAQTEEPYTYVEQMPSFPGGNEVMYKFISENIVYPETCSNSKIPMHVIVQFIVDTSGYLIHPKVIRGYTCGVNEESLRVIGLMNEMDQRWTPGMHNGRKVPVSFTLPIKFISDKK